MKNKMVPAFYALVIFLAISCKDPHWGGTFKDFSGNQSGPLSRQYAEATLKTKWQQLFRDSLSVLKLDSDVVDLGINSIVVAVSPVSEQVREQLAEERLGYNAQFAKAVALIRKIEESNLYLEKMYSICSERQAFETLGMRRSLLLDAMGAMTGSIAERVTYALHLNVIESGIDIATALLTKKQYEKQERLFNEGKVLLEKNVIGDEELFSLSKNVCTKEQADYQPLYLDFLKRLKGQRDALDFHFRSFYFRNRVLDSTLIARDIEGYIERHNLRGLMTEIQQTRDMLQLSKTLETVAERIEELKPLSIVRPLKTREMMNWEQSLDETKGLIVQLDLMLPKMTDPVFVARIEGQKKKLIRIRQAFAQNSPFSKNEVVP